jgi:hypothetical protein
VPLKLWLRDPRPNGLQQQYNFFKGMTQTVGRVNDYFFDIDKLANFHKPVSVPFNKWVTEPSQKFWIEYAVKNKIITEDEAPEYNKDPINPSNWIKPGSLGKILTQPV